MTVVLFRQTRNIPHPSNPYKDLHQLVPKNNMSNFTSTSDAASPKTSKTTSTSSSSTSTSTTATAAKTSSSTDPGDDYTSAPFLQMMRDHQDKPNQQSTSSNAPTLTDLYAQENVRGSCDYFVEKRAAGTREYLRKRQKKIVAILRNGKDKIESYLGDHYPTEYGAAQLITATSANVFRSTDHKPGPIYEHENGQQQNKRPNAKKQLFDFAEPWVNAIGEHPNECPVCNQEIQTSTSGISQRVGGHLHQHHSRNNKSSSSSSSSNNNDNNDNKSSSSSSSSSNNTTTTNASKSTVICFICKSCNANPDLHPTGNIEVQTIMHYGTSDVAKAAGIYYGTTASGLKIAICEATSVERSLTEVADEKSGTKGRTYLHGFGVNPISESEFKSERGEKYVPYVSVTVSAADEDGWIFQLLKTLFCEKENGNPMLTLDDMKTAFKPEPYVPL